MTLAAVRTVSDDGKVRIIEGLGIPFGGPLRGSDTYGTRATKDTNLHLDLYPDGGPLLYHHGLDPEIGFSRIGDWKPLRTTDKGVWVRAQLDKAHAWSGAIEQLLDEKALGFSPGTRSDNMSYARSGDWVDWPVMEMSLTPTRSNPWAIITAVRSADPAPLLEIIEKAEPTAPPDDAAAQLAIRAIADVRGIETFSDLAAAAEMNEELPEAFDTLRSAIYSAIYAVDADRNPAPADEKRAAIQTSLDQFGEAVLSILDSATPAARSGAIVLYALRAGRRNSSTDQERIDSIHDHTAALGATAHANDKTAPADEAAARSADLQPALEIVQSAVRDDADPLRELAIRTGEEAARRFLERH